MATGKISLTLDEEKTKETAGESDAAEEPTDAANSNHPRNQLQPFAKQKTQMTEKQVVELENQGYRMVGHHSAVKVCGWTRSMIRGKGGCYKYKFYGIRSHQCLQMTTSMFCANRCTFCWRGEKAPVSKTWYGPIDEPESIVKEAVKRHVGLLIGFKGNPNANKFALDEMQNIRHVALSLTGEPISYPLINEILDEFHRNRISTFLVTNAQFPEAIERLKCLTQLYISVDAPNKDALKKIDRPLFPDYYERLLKSLDAMKTKKFRTVIRLTVVRGQNDNDLPGYKELIERGQPCFIEVKGYVYVGASLQFHQKTDMPEHAYVVEFSKRLAEFLPEYEIADFHEPSRVVLFMHKKMHGKKYIDFPNFFKLADSKGEASAMDYSTERMAPNE